MCCRQQFHNTDAEEGCRGRGALLAEALWMVVPQMQVPSDGEAGRVDDGGAVDVGTRHGCE
jgi:hypothetical protein